MPRVLLLRDSTTDFQTERSVELLSRLPDTQLRTLGPGGSYPNPAAALYHLRARRNDFDLIHAFGNHALTLAAMSTRLPLIYSPPPLASARTIQWTRAVSAYRRVETICPTSTLRRLHVEHGLPLPRTHLVRPGVDSSRLPKRRHDPDARARLGLSPDDRVILAVGEHTHAAHQTASLWAAGILHVLDPRYKVLLWGRGRLTPYLTRFALKVGQPGILAVAPPDTPFEDLLPAADVAILSPRGLIPTLPISITMAAGLPIVSSVTYTTSELLEDRHTALLAPKPRPKLLAKRITELYDDPQLQWSITDRAKAEAYEYYPLTQFLSQYRTAYDQLASGGPVDLAPTEANFHER